jgi:hypothetical protein
MKKISTLVAFLIIFGVIYWSFSAMKPSKKTQKVISKTEFSVDNALYHLKNITKKKHHVGSIEHTFVRDYIVNELIKLKLNPEIQIQPAINKDWRAGTTAENILVRIKGTENGKALLLLSHYDSNLHSSLGASDAGSGVVTILEGIRAFLAKNIQPKNDIIILISDAEELGLLGAQAFVDHHSWAKDVGLVLNFEARGSGGPSYMLMETNSKNSKLLSEFLNSNPNFPAASSLMYSVYKKLPNDTDLTVFREGADINGFNFAFIGDHFDYHTAQDSYERLDIESLLHQSDYLMTSLAYFSNSDLQNFKSDEDYVYVNFPFVKLLKYPFSWVFPLLLIAIVIFTILMFFGVSSHKITLKGALKGFVPLLISLILCTGVSFYLWKLLQIIHPQYQDILHGFTYNGYQYIIAFCLLTIWMLFSVYKKFGNIEKQTDLIIAPIFIWLVINFLIYQNLQGAGFFIIPVFVALLILAINIFMSLDEKAKPILFTLISIPTIYIFAPMIKMFPVGLGLKNLFISAILVVLLFGILILAFQREKPIRRVHQLIGFLTIIFFGLATFNSGFSIENKKPNSLVYIQNTDTNIAYFATYDKNLDNYNKAFLGENPVEGSLINSETASKYNTRFSFHKETLSKNFIPSVIAIERDTIIGNEREINFKVLPQRKVTKIEFLNQGNLSVKHLKVNGVFANKGKGFKINNGTLLSYTLGNSDKNLSISIKIDKDTPLNIFMNEISYDLLNNPSFNISPRSPEMMPMPFVTNDAIILTRELKL